MVPRRRESGYTKGEMTPDGNENVDDLESKGLI